MATVSDHKNMRLTRCMSVLMERLGRRFYVNSYPGTNKVLGIMEKAPPGQVHPDGTKYKDHGGITFRELELLDANTATDEQYIEALRAYLLERRDLTNSINRNVAPITPTDIEAIASRRVEEILRERLKELQIGKATPEEIKEQAVNKTIIAATESEYLPSGIQGTKKSEAEKRLLAERAAWEKRAKEMGVDAPKLRSDGGVDGRWIRNAEKLWADHLKQQGRTDERIPQPSIEGT